VDHPPHEVFAKVLLTVRAVESHRIARETIQHGRHDGFVARWPDARAQIIADNK
jgi:hypothetical protein